jgi:transcriptional regulator with XRE-family HTH domain
MGKAKKASRDEAGAVAERFPDRLRELREAAGLSQGELAARAGISQPRITEYERGRRSPTWESVVRLAMILGVSTDAFRTSGGAKRIPKKSPGST